MGEKSNALQKWVDNLGGPNQAGKKLGVTGHAVRVWLRGTSYPSSPTIMKMVRLSRGALTMQTILSSIDQLKK